MPCLYVGFKPNLVDEAAAARSCAQPILQGFVKSELAHDCPVAETARGYLNEAAKLNAPRPSQHPTDSPSRVNTTTPCKTPEYAPLSSVGASSAKLGDCVFKVPDPETTSRCEVLCSDAKINEVNSIDTIPNSFLQVSIRSKQTSVPFPLADAPQSASTFVDPITPAMNDILP